MRVLPLLSLLALVACGPSSGARSGSGSGGAPFDPARIPTGTGWFCFTMTVTPTADLSSCSRDEDGCKKTSSGFSKIKSACAPFAEVTCWTYDSKDGHPEWACSNHPAECTRDSGLAVNGSVCTQVK